MKHFFFLSTFTLITNVANCQLDKKYWLVGGTGSLYSYSDYYTNTAQPNVSGKLTDITLSANVGYFIYDKFVVGLKPGINSTKSRGFNSASVATKDISIYAGPFARYYLLNKEKQFNILIDGAYQFGKYLNFDESKGKITNFSIMAGPEIFFNTSVGIELLVGYLYQKKSIESQTGFSDERKGVNVSVGFQFHLISD